MSKWRWYVIKRVRDGKYFTGVYRSGPRPSYKFGNLEDAKSWRLRDAMSTLCKIRRHYRQRERFFNRKTGHRRTTFLPPDRLILEVKGDPKAEVRYPWQMPM